MTIKHTKMVEITASKQAILDVLKATYPDELGDKTIADLIDYGVDPIDSSYARFLWAANQIDSQLLEQEVTRFPQGTILQLLQSIDPAHFADKKVEHLHYYEDDEADSSLARFFFKDPFYIKE